MQAGLIGLIVFPKKLFFSPPKLNRWGVHPPPPTLPITKSIDSSRSSSREAASGSASLQPLCSLLWSRTSVQHLHRQPASAVDGTSWKRHCWKLLLLLLPLLSPFDQIWAILLIFFNINTAYWRLSEDFFICYLFVFFFFSGGSVTCLFLHSWSSDVIYRPAFFVVLKEVKKARWRGFYCQYL